MINILGKIFSTCVVSILVIGILFVFTQSSKGYDDQTTHPGLTDEIVDFYNFSFDEKITAEEKEWIVQGAIDEDTPPRWINHFYDPINKVGWSGENTGIWPTMLVQYFSATVLSSRDPVNSLFWLHAQEYQAEYGQYKGNRTWERAIYEAVNGNKEEAYYTLGFILHLIEDATVPDHTRNDTHAHELRFVTGDYGSPYEEFSKQFTRSNLDIAKELKKNGDQPVIKSSIDEYLISLAEYSNKYFFSKDTINNEKYDNPDIKSMIFLDGYGYGEDENGEEFPLVKTATARVYEDGRYIKIITYFLPEKDNNSIVLSNYFSRLSRKAVLSGAGVINLFKQEVEKAEKEKLSALPKESSSVFSVTGRIYQAKDFISNTASALGNTLSSAYDSAKTTISNIVKIDVKRNVGDFATNNQTASLLDAVMITPQPAQIQGPPLNTAQAEPAPVEIFPAPETIQSQPLDNTPVVKTSQPATQPLVFVGGAMPIVAAPAPVMQATTQTQNTEQETTTTGTAATTTPPINTTHADIISPVITILGENPVTIYTGDRYADAGATASDEIDGVRTVSLSSNVNTFTAGSYTVTYTATDLAGNTATATRGVNILDAVTTLAYSDLNSNGTADSDEEDVVVVSNTSLPAGEYRFSNLVITASSTLTLMGNPVASTTFKGVKITARAITVDPDSSISADIQGYARASGPGKSSNPTGGASHGGIGAGNTATSTYGSTLAPIDMGSGGNGYYSNAYGGGAIKLVVGDTLTINGTISANGGETSSGGSIYLVANALAGNGMLRTEGGGSYWAGQYIEPGAGGRISINSLSSSFSGSMRVSGGCRWSSGFLITCAEDGTVGFFDMTNNDFYARAPWQFLASDGPFTFDRIIIENGATVSIESGAHVTANELLIIGASSLSVGSGSVVTIPSIWVDGQSSLTFSGNETLTMDTFSIMGTSTVSVAQGVPLVLSVRDLTLSVGSSINLDNKGYAPASGLGKSLNPLGGASHGGIGAENTATSTYGSAFAPTDMGSGGNGHSSNAYGGGAVKLTASGTLTIDGTISANGGETASGGSIYLVAETITGTGALRAGGGGTYWNGQYIEPGAGGRIALDSPNSSFSGGMSVAGTCRSSSGFIIACSEDGTVVYGASIASFDFTAFSPAVQGTINERAHTIDLSVPHGTDITAQAPTITLSRGATVSPASGEVQDFTNPITYTVTSATSSVQTYMVNVTVDPAPPDTTPPSMVNYTLNGVEESVTTASTTVAVTLAMTASEDVDWVSVKIENEDEPNNYKIFYSGTNCTDDTNTCTKIWDGAVSHGELTSGTYRIKVHMRDAADNEFSGYLSPYTVIITD